MFNFTTQTVYNQISKTSGDPKRNLWINAGENPVLRIGNTRFTADEVEDVQVKNPTIESLASVTFDMSKIVIDSESTETETTGRIALYIGLSMNSQDSFYANDLVYKGKPLYVEFAVKKGDTAAVIAARVKANADKYFLFVAQEKILDVTVTNGTVKFTGVNGYQQIKGAALQKFDPEAKKIDCCANQGEFVDVVTGVPAIYTVAADGTVTITTKKLDAAGNAEALASNEVAIAPGIEAFGDYNWIIHNLRLPTAANTNFWAVTKDEMPAVGQVYTQFIIRIKKERAGIMGGMVGAVGTSMTTHILYVAGKVSDTNSPAKMVSDALFTNGGLNISAKKKTVADTKLAKPFGTDGSTPATSE